MAVGMVKESKFFTSYVKTCSFNIHKNLLDCAVFNLLAFLYLLRGVKLSFNLYDCIFEKKNRNINLNKIHVY